MLELNFLELSLLLSTLTLAGFLYFLGDFAGFVDVEGNAASCEKIEGDVGESVEVDLELIDEGDSVELRL